MSVPTFQIPAYPISPSGELLVNQEPLRTLTGELETRTVALGRKEKKAGNPSVKIENFIDLLSAVPPPASIDYTAKALSSIRQTLGNAGPGAEGDCVIASGGHGVGVWSGNDTDSGGVIVQTWNEALSEYHRIGGPQDNGLVITDALDDMVQTGLLCAGTRRKIDGWAGVAQTQDMIRACIAEFGSMRIGFNVPGEWMNSASEGFVWDTPRSYSFVGGHDVRLAGYTTQGIIVCTWGLLGIMTWKAILDSRIVDELYVELSPNYYGPDNVSPSGFQMAALKAALAQVKSGQVPSWEPNVGSFTVTVSPSSGPVPLSVSASSVGAPTPPVMYDFGAGKGFDTASNFTYPTAGTFTVTAKSGSQLATETVSAGSSPPPPPPPPPVTAPSYSVTVAGQIPSGLFGHMTAVTLTGTATPAPNNFHAPAPMAGAIPWVVIIGLLSKVLPIVIADIAAKKTFAEIVADVFAALFPPSKVAELKGWTPQQWMDAITKLVQFILALFGK